MSVQRFFLSDDYEINNSPKGDMVRMSYRDYKNLESRLAAYEKDTDGLVKWLWEMFETVQEVDGESTLENWKDEAKLYFQKKPPR